MEVSRFRGPDQDRHVAQFFQVFAENFAIFAIPHGEGLTQRPELFNRPPGMIA